MRNIFFIALISLVTAGSSLAQAPADIDSADDPYLRELVRRSRGSNDLLASSISDALRLRLDDLASGFLTSLAGRKPAADELARLAQQISADRLLRVLLEPQFTDPAKAQATALLDALRARQLEPARISAAIKKLTSESAEEKLPALRIVLAGGNQSIALLSVEAAKQTDDAVRDELLRVLLRLGEGGPAAIRQLAIYGEDTIRAGALAALMRLGADRARPVVVAAAMDPNSTAAEEQIATSWLLRRYPSLPTHAEAEVYLLDRLAAVRDALRFVDDKEATVDLWTIGDDRLSVKHTPVTAIDAAWREVIDQARLLLRIGDLSPAARDRGIAAALAYRYQLDPLLPAETGKEVASTWGPEAVTVESLAMLIERALERNDLTVAIAAMELLDQSMGQDAALLMTNHSEVPTPLVSAVLHPQPRVRYQAAAAIGRLGFADAYAGSSEVMDRWLAMASLTREPIVLLVEPRIEVAGQIERVMLSLGYRIEVVRTVADAVSTVDRGGDLRFVISDTVLPDMSALELVDRIRRQTLGHDLPILLHGPIDNAVEMAINDARWLAATIHVQLPATAAGWSLLLDPLEKARPLPSLSAVERFDFRLAAIESLGQIASQPDVFAFYEFDKLVGSAISADLPGDKSSGVAFGEPRLAVLSVAANRDSQTTLADLAMSSQATPEKRAAAAHALLKSIERVGVLLSGDDLLRITRTRESLSDELGTAIDRVLAEIGRRSDVGGITKGSVGKQVITPLDKRVRPPDI